MPGVLRVLLMALIGVSGQAAYAVNPITCFEQFLPRDAATQAVYANVFIGEIDVANPERWKSEPLFLGISKYGGDVSCLRFSDFFYRNRAHLDRARCEVKILGDSDDPYAVAHVSVGAQRDWLYLGTGSVADVQERAQYEQESCELVLNFVKSVVRK